jgi:hypothetical protein
VTTHGAWSDNWVSWTLLHTTRDCTLQNSITQRLVFSVTLSLLWSVTSSTRGRSSALVLTSSQAGHHLTPNSYFSNCRVNTLYSIVMTAGPRWPRQGPHSEHRFQQLPYSHVRVFCSHHVKLLNHCLATDVCESCSLATAVYNGITIPASSRHEKTYNAYAKLT